jgi:hypothetical protein
VLVTGDEGIVHTYALLNDEEYHQSGIVIGGDVGVGNHGIQNQKL